MHVIRAIREVADVRGPRLPGQMFVRQLHRERCGVRFRV
jgi:hypothetical protein